MKKLLVIGAGIGQLNIIQKAKKLGCHVTVVTIPGQWPALQEADDVWYIDIYDRDQIVQKAREEKIDAVLSDQNDLMMPTVAYVAEKLGLPGNTFAQVNAYCNKNTFRDNCDKLGIPVPKHTAVRDLAFNPVEHHLQYPLVVKPADSQSSIGVKKVADDAQLKQALEIALERSKTHEAIVEEFFVGKELVCEGFISDGEYYLLSFADRKYFDLKEVMIPSQTVFPSMVSERIRQKILECEKKMAKYVNPAFGITHSEYLYNEETEEIRVVETALRGGGVFISSHLIPLATNIDINDVLLAKALGKEVDVQAVFASRQEKASGYVCFCIKEGTISSVEGIREIQGYPFVHLAMLGDIAVGKPSGKLTYKGARKGPILVSGENREDLEKNIRTVQNTLKVYVNHELSQAVIWE